MMDRSSQSAVPSSRDVQAIEVVYTSRGTRAWDLTAWLGMFRDLVASRELIAHLFIRDITSKYRQTILGILWAVLMPVCMVGTFVFLSKSKVFDVGDVQVPYVLWSLIGVTVWEVFRTGLVVSSNALVAGGSMVVKINFLKEALVFASLGQPLVDLFVRLVLVALAFVYFGIAPGWTAVFFPLSLVPLLLLTAGLGLLLSILNALFRDVGNIVTVLMTFLLFLTPVLYIPQGALETLNQYNPLAHLVTVPRDLLLGRAQSIPMGFWVSSLGSFIGFFVFWRVFQIVIARITERMGSR